MRLNSLASVLAGLALVYLLAPVHVSIASAACTHSTRRLGFREHPKLAAFFATPEVSKMPNDTYDKSNETYCMPKETS